MLEVGAGTGYYALPIAESLGPGGRLDAFDLQQAILGDLMRRARAHGLNNLVATQGDAQSLPYPDASFDAAYLVTVLHEVPDQELALRETRRVLKAGGRLVVGDLAPFVTAGAVRARAEAAGFAFVRLTSSGAIGYFARFAVA